jgi:hypothetical protein
MKWLKTVGGEISGLFVDDGNFAIAIVMWLGIVWFLSAQILADRRWNGVVLFAGLVSILVESAMRRARQ